MSIWEKCQEHNAVPFFGFPVKPTFKNGVIIWEFPEGYAPNGDKTSDVAKKLQEFTGGDLIEVSQNVIKILPSEKHIGVFIFDAFMKGVKKI
jgi:hypothetical protein